MPRKRGALVFWTPIALGAALAVVLGAALPGPALGAGSSSNGFFAAQPARQVASAKHSAPMTVGTRMMERGGIRIMGFN